MKKLTTNLIVESVEACLAFWRDRIGFEVVTEVPDGERIGFVILRRGGVELMLQSRASLQKDVPPVAAGPFAAVLYFEVDDLAAIRTALAGWPMAAPERTTFYGAKEIITRDPAGNVVFFSVHE